jgi:hypothetical protein
MPFHFPKRRHSPVNDAVEWHLHLRPAIRGKAKRRAVEHYRKHRRLPRAIEIQLLSEAQRNDIVFRGELEHRFRIVILRRMWQMLCARFKVIKNGR